MVASPWDKDQCDLAVDTMRLFAVCGALKCDNNADNNPARRRRTMADATPQNAQIWTMGMDAEIRC